MKNKMGFALILTLATFAFAGAASADTLTLSGITWDVTVNPSNVVTMTVQCTDQTTCGSWYMGDAAVKAFSSYTGNPTTISAPSGYTAQSGGLNNAGCSGSGSGYICWNESAPYTLMGNTLFTFSASVTDPTTVSPYSIKGIFYSDINGTDKVLQVSQDATGGQVPEPSSMLLLGTGLAGAAGFVRRSRK